MPLPTSLREDLLWWKDIFEDFSQKNNIRSGLFALEIFSDASLTGWGTVCGGERSHGFWSPEERFFHINYLELLAIFHALRCFASHVRHSDILLRVDNWWPAQPWFPLFNRIMINRPIHFDPDPNMLMSPFRDVHPAWSRITLVAARLSGRLLRVEGSHAQH
ncbi:hypothetical protein ALC57_02994 [Trachymyrmex cornetzi]|uniref:RNase H type-1 domain-containing protein n=1 Tax=Trachymyrmex cornetzi TaxID=471704 RepID=A0A151JMT4_9HYME|nr:hypothetical protein ALC57_02994 [Trachymyrmex cornetzi]